MPYTGASDPSLPARVKKLPIKKRRQWVNVFNSALKRCMAGQTRIKPANAKSCESFAFQNAYGVVKKEEDMSNARKKRKRESLARKAAAVAEEPLADEKMEEITDEEAQVLLETYAKDEEKEELPLGGAQTWEQRDEFVKAEVTVSEEKQAKSEFRTMVDNILDDASLGIEEKGSKIAMLAEGFGKQDEIEEEDDDIIAKVLSFLGLQEAAKARMTRASINDLPDTAFAYIEPGGKKEDGKTVPRSLRHYPIHDAAHVRNALARAAQAIKKGGKTAAIAKKALAKIRAKAKKLGIGKSSGFIVQKDVKGNNRWFGWVSNKFRDRDVKSHPKGEIIAEAAHKEFVDWVYEKAEIRMPQLWLWHTPKTAMKGRADWLDYADGFLLASGPLTEKEAGMWTQLLEKHEMGMSHGFFKSPQHYDAENGVINKYRSFEGSGLPLTFVANEWTDFTTLLQEAKEMGFTPDRRAFLVDALGEEKVAELEASTKDLAEQLKELGIEFKEVEEEQVVEKEETLEKPVESETTATDVKALMESLGLDKLSEYLEGQEAVIKDLKKTAEEQNVVIADLKKSDDEKVADVLKPRVDVKKDIQPIWLRQLSKSDETILTEEEEESLKVAKETGAGWVSAAMGVTADPGANVPM